jgi:DNA-binding transcriptional ArsR family regulator
MSIEPSQARTVCIRPVMPPKPERKTLPPMPDYREEARQVRERFEKTWGRTNTPGADHENVRRKAEADARRDELAAKALKLLARREATSGEMREAFGVSENQMRNALGRLREQGMANFFRVGVRTVWRKLGTKQSQAITITVRGDTFPSYSACARHFDISVQAVHHAVKNGKVDGIGMRKRMVAAE